MWKFLHVTFLATRILRCLLDFRIHWHKNPSDRTMALGSTQPLIEMSTGSISWGVKAVGALGWQPYHHPVPLSRNLGALTSWNPLGLSRPVMGLLYLLSRFLVVLWYHVVNTLALGFKYMSDRTSVYWRTVVNMRWRFTILQGRYTSVVPRNVLQAYEDMEPKIHSLLNLAPDRRQYSGLRREMAVDPEEPPESNK